MENVFSNSGPQQDLLGDLAIDLQQASRGKRFANYLIDLIFCYLLAIPIVLIMKTRGLMDTQILSSDWIMIYLFRIISRGFFMGLIEAIFKGRTLGKLITRTRAVNEDGSPISAQTAFLRGLSRLVPFEVFSALGEPSYPWHDRWTRTYVIDETRSVIST